MHIWNIVFTKIMPTFAYVVQPGALWMQYLPKIHVSASVKGLCSTLTLLILGLASLFNIITGSEVFSIFPSSTFCKIEGFGFETQMTYTHVGDHHRGIVSIHDAPGREFLGSLCYLGDELGDSR